MIDLQSSGLRTGGGEGCGGCGGEGRIGGDGRVGGVGGIEGDGEWGLSGHGKNWQLLLESLPTKEPSGHCLASAVQNTWAIERLIKERAIKKKRAIMLSSKKKETCFYLKKKIP